MSLWCEKMEAKLRKMHEDGLSASQIASRLPIVVSRNAVLGKLHRLGLCGTRPNSKYDSSKHRSNASRAATSRANAASMVKPSKCLSAKEIVKKVCELKALSAEMHEAMKPAPLILRPDPVEPLRVALLDLKEHMCRWPIGDPQDEAFSFCGHHKTQGSYCSAHASIAFAGVPARKLPKRKIAA